MRPYPKAFLAVFGALLLSACGGGDTTAVNGDFTGTWTLTSINGVLPYTVALDPNTTATFTAGTFTIVADGTFTDVLDYHTDSSAGRIFNTSTCVGTYTQQGNSLTFAEQLSSTDAICGGLYNGLGSGSTLTISFSSTFHAVYSK
jgi:hypothetical protein